MEIESPLAEGHPHECDKIIKLHPLAIIGISDHHTRITCGGSALPSTSPTIGLLFGQQSSSSSSSSVPGSVTISIIDAEEVGMLICTSSSSSGILTEDEMHHIQTKIELHQKVFPMHQVVGWYRVVDNTNRIRGQNDDDMNQDYGAIPTEQDLEIHNGWMKQFHSNPVFVLMDATVDSVGERLSRCHEEVSAETDGEKAREKLDRDEELPFTIYECISDSNQLPEKSGQVASPVFVNLNFELETYEPERLAVERVFNDRSNTTQSAYNGSQKDNQLKGGLKSTGNAKGKDNTMEKDSGDVVSDHEVPNPSELHIDSILTSVDAINARISILLDFLYKTRDGVIEPDYALLRQVMSLVRQLPYVMGRHPLYQNTDDQKGDRKSVV